MSRFDRGVWIPILAMAFCQVAYPSCAQNAPVAPEIKEPVRTSRPPVPVLDHIPRRLSGSRLNFGHLAESPGLHLHNDSYELLKYEAVRYLLDLSPDQVSKLAKARIEKIRLRQHALREAGKTEEDGPIRNASGLPPLADERRDRRITKALESLPQKYEQLFVEILQPQQIKRLNEIALELRIQSVGIVAFLSDPQMVAELQISDEQSAELREMAAEASKKFDKKVMELKREIRGEILSKLDKRQSAVMKRMLGEPFDLQEASKHNRD